MINNKLMKIENKGNKRIVNSYQKKQISSLCSQEKKQKESMTSYKNPQLHDKTIVIVIIIAYTY